MPNGKPSNGPNAPIAFMVAGSEMVSASLLGLLFDYLLGTMPGFTIGLTLLGVAAAFLQLNAMAKAFGKKPPNAGSGS